MAANYVLQDWENLVKKQLKTQDIYTILTTENLQGVDVKPYYHEVAVPLRNLPKVEESTQLVSYYRETLEDDVYAFLLEENVGGLQDKNIYIATRKLAHYLSTNDNNRYFSLIDPFDETQKLLDVTLGKELWSKSFERKICIDVSFHQNAGASIIQQLAIALSKAKELVEEYGSEILNVLIFKMAIGGNYFMEIAKFRAFKLVFNQLSKEFNQNETPYIFAETSLRNKSVFDEENNLIRSTLELAAGMIGGADALFSNDYKIIEHSNLSEEISFKQQIVLAYESIVNVFEDSANGSYFVEDLTQQFAEKSWKLFIQMEENGGYLELLKNGSLAKEIFQHAVQEQKWVMEGKIKLIGVNMYPALQPTKSMDELYSEDEIRKVRWSEMYE